MSLSSFGSIKTNYPDNILTKTSREHITDNQYSISFPSLPHTQNFVSDKFNLVISTQNQKGRHKMSSFSLKSQQLPLPSTNSSFLSSSCSSSECKIPEYTHAMEQVFLVIINTFLCRSELGVGSCRMSKRRTQRRISLSYGRSKDSTINCNRKLKILN
jgi:hypothetical protein